MCGFFCVSGGESTPERSELAKETLQLLRHRGPDQDGCFSNGSTFLGHRRLSIQDLTEAGRQPMSSAGVVIAVNGEIYNFKKLRRELVEDTFNSESDSEVLLHGYLAWGIDTLLEKIEGMYAGVIYDLRNDKIFVFRDRVGIKPVYWAKYQGALVCASELKCIKHFVGSENLKLSPESLFDYLNYRYFPRHKTAYDGLYKLEPGHYLEFSPSTAAHDVKCYWHLKDINSQDSEDIAKEKIRKILDKNLSLQMVSDVPLGFFLSGGLDSSVVVAQSSKIKDTIKCFSMGFSDSAHDETYYAKLVTERVRAKHEINVVERSDADQLEKKMLEWFDQPFSDTSAVPTKMVSEFAKQYSTVVLTGDGGDEVFGGYRWYERFETLCVLKKFIRLPNFLVQLVGAFRPTLASKLGYLTASDEIELYALIRGGIPKSAKTKWRKRLGISDDYDEYWAYRQFFRPEINKRKAAQWLDFHTYLPDDILTKVDRVSMIHSLECRVPLLCTELIEYVMSLTPKVVYRGGELKGLLKFAYQDDLPAEIIRRDKKGFSLPNKKWRDDKVSSFQERVLLAFLNN